MIYIDQSTTHLTDQNIESANSKRKYKKDLKRILLLTGLIFTTFLIVLISEVFYLHSFSVKPTNTLFATNQPTRKVISIGSDIITNDQPLKDQIEIIKKISKSIIDLYEKEKNEILIVYGNTVLNRKTENKKISFDIINLLGHELASALNGELIKRNIKNESVGVIYTQSITDQNSKILKENKNNNKDKAIKRLHLETTGVNAMFKMFPIVLCGGGIPFFTDEVQYNFNFVGNDEAAGILGKNAKAKSIVFMSKDNGEMGKEINVNDAKKMIEDKGVKEGIKDKLKAAVDFIEGEKDRDSIFVTVNGKEENIDLNNGCIISNK